MSSKNFHSRDLRKGRHSQPGRAYLVTVNCHQRQPHFTDLANGRCAVRAMRFLHDQNYVESLCFVVMPDHVHWLMTLGEKLSLSMVVNQFKSWTTRWIHQLNPASGIIWQAGFHDRAVRQDGDLRKISRYVVANPLRSGLVETIGEYSLWDAGWL